MSEASTSSKFKCLVTSEIMQFKITKIPEIPKMDQDFTINQLQTASIKAPNINEIFENIIVAISEPNINKFKVSLNFLHTIDKGLIEKYLSTNEIDIFILLSKYSQLEMLEYLIEQREILPYLTPLDKRKESKSIKNTFLNCMCKSDTAMLETYYNHVVGDLHWVINKTSSKNDIQTLKNILCLLNEAYTEYKDILNEEFTQVNPQILVDIRCITFYNEFQIELYDKLNKVKNKMDKWQSVNDEDNTIREIKALIDIIDITISSHAESLDKINENIPALSLLKDTDKSTVYKKALKFYMFRNYLFKTDYNVCLLILDNLYLLKERLKMPDNICQELESHLYYFIYNCKSKWSFYLSKTERLEVENPFFEENGELHMIRACYDIDIGALWTYLIIYLERQVFLDKLSYFKEKLNVPILLENIKLRKTEMSQEEEQPLIPLPEIRDDFSLRKMYHNLEGLPSAEDIKHKTEWAQLIIERVLLVVGEFMKSTKNSMHLDATTQALLLAEIPLDIVTSLKEIRQFLSKSDKCQILRRIELSKHGQNVYTKVLNDLQHIKDVIKRQINANRCLVNRSLIYGCRQTLHARRECIKEIVQNILPFHFDAVTKGLGAYLQMPTQYIGNPLLENFYETYWKPTGLSLDLMMELAQLQHDLIMLYKKNDQVQQSIRTFIDKNYSYYKEVIVTLLDKINYQKENWKYITSECLKFQFTLFSEYPNELDLNRLRIYLKLNNSDSELTHVLNNVIEIKPLWDIIEKIFDFIINKCNVLNDCIAELKWGMISGLYADICRTTYKTDSMSENVKKLFYIIEESGVGHARPSSRKYYKYEGIRDFKDILLINNFVTTEEIEYISKNTSQRECLRLLTFDKSKYLVEMKQYVDAISELEPYDTKSEEIIRNVKNRDNNLLNCYLRRLQSLSTLLNGQPKDLLILRYKYDGQFKIWLEMLLIDIFNILKTCNGDKNLRKGNRLLAEINLRHVLTHGCPLLEVVGNFLDANDVPSELISKALEFLVDLESVQALNTLKQNKLDFNSVHKSAECDKAEQQLFSRLKKSKNWEQYLSLLPENKVCKKPKTKKKPQKKQDPQSEFIKAMKENANEKIKELLNIIDLDLKDQNGKAAVHHAAILNNVEVLTLLKENGADLNNINQNDNNRTALHYAAMKGNSGAIDFLIESGAIIHKDVNGHTYKDIIDMQMNVLEKEPKEDDVDPYLLSCFECFGIED